MKCTAYAKKLTYKYDDLDLYDAVELPIWRSK